MTNKVEAGEIRILRIIARMNVGGPAWQVSVLTRGFNHNEFRSMLISGEVEIGEADFVDLRDPKLPVRRVPVLGRSVRFGDDLRAFFAIRRTIREFRPHIVHTHTAKAGVLGRIAAASCRVPIRVHTFHGHLLHGYFSGFVAWGLLLIERILARLTTALISVGEQVRDDLVKARIGRPNQHVVIPPGVESLEVLDQDSARSQLGLPSKVPIIVFVGRLTPIKRPDRLIEAMGLVLQRRPDAILIIAGEGDLTATSRCAAEPLGSSIRFLGWRSDIAVLYSAADCAVLTSDNEGMPVSLIEAAIAGVPGVTTDVGSAREVVLDGVTGIVVEAKAEAVAEGLLCLLDHDLSARMGAAAQERAEAYFSSERLLNDHHDLYMSLLNGSDT